MTRHAFAVVQTLFLASGVLLAAGATTHAEPFGVSQATLWQVIRNGDHR